MYSEAKKEELLQGQEKVQPSGQEKPENSEAESEMCECECEVCLRPAKPRLQFEKTTGPNKFYYQTRSRKTDRAR